jgi:broad specificity phosphatase PhoE
LRIAEFGLYGIHDSIPQSAILKGRLSYIYFIRHAQAGSRDNYDVLSELGQRQARLLGEHFLAQGVEPGAVYSGGMQRQRDTAEIVCGVLARSGLAAPEVITDDRWNEFSLISVYRALAKRMMNEDAGFARDIEEMQQAITRDPHTTGGAVGRCDQAVIRAWMEQRYPDYEGESWASFRSRIHSCGASISSNHESEKAVAIFTSATPIAITVGAALGLSDERLLSILGVIYNTSFSIMRARNGELRLFTFNATSHLKASERTFR